MGLRSSLIAAAALIVIPIAVVVSYKHWLNTRIPVPLNMPVSLASRHISSNKFYINLTGRYYVDLTVDYSFENKIDCPRYGPNSPLKTHVTLLREGEKVGEMDGLPYVHTADWNVDRKGNYQLHLDLLSDATCLNAGHPTLKVVSYDFCDYEDWYWPTVWLSFMPIVAGFGLLGYAIFLRLRAPSAEEQAASDRAKQATATWHPRVIRGSPRTLRELPAFGFYCSTVLVFLVFTMMILEMPFPSKGITVSLVPKSPIPNSEDLFLPPVIIRVRSVGPNRPPEIYVNSVPVKEDRLRQVVKDELKIRSKWVVYVDGDSNLAWQNVMDAIDTVKGLHAQVVLVTPRTRELIEKRR